MIMRSNPEAFLSPKVLNNSPFPSEIIHSLNPERAEASGSCTHPSPTQSTGYFQQAHGKQPPWRYREYFSVLTEQKFSAVPDTTPSLKLASWDFQKKLFFPSFPLPYKLSEGMGHIYFFSV